MFQVVYAHPVSGLRATDRRGLTRADLHFRLPSRTTQTRRRAPRFLRSRQPPTDPVHRGPHRGTATRLREQSPAGFTAELWPQLLPETPGGLPRWAPKRRLRFLHLRVAFTHGHASSRRSGSGKGRTSEMPPPLLATRGPLGILLCVELCLAVLRAYRGLLNRCTFNGTKKRSKYRDEEDARDTEERYIDCITKRMKS